jgi:hypothetical protein
MPLKKKPYKFKKKIVKKDFEREIRETAIKRINKLYELLNQGKPVSQIFDLNAYRKIKSIPSLYNELIRNPLLAEKMRLIEEKEKNRL